MNPNHKKIFISYSKHDIRHKEALLKQLSGLRGKIITWNDRDIEAGEDWDARIKEELHKADVILYLVSANSMATDYIQNIELPIIEERHQKGECVLVPIIVDFCDWQEQSFAKYNALPEKDIPIVDTQHWINENQAWLKVISGIKEIIKNIKIPISPPQQQVYLKNYIDDIVIHAAEHDLRFAETFKLELQKYLAAKLGGFNFRLSIQTNQKDFSSAAILIILFSNNYMQQYGNNFLIPPQLQQGHLLLVEMDKTSKPESLETVIPYSFYQQLRLSTTVYEAIDRSYQLAMGEMVVELNDLLQQLKIKEPIIEIIKEQIDEKLIFINVATEDRQLGKQIQAILSEQYQRASILPSTTGTQIDIGNKYELCHAVLFLYVASSEDWIDRQLRSCSNALSQYQKKFNIIAIHVDEKQLDEQGNPRINFVSPRLNLQHYFCPPENIKDYLPRFVEALK